MIPLETSRTWLSPESAIYRLPAESTASHERSSGAGGYRPGGRACGSRFVQSSSREAAGWRSTARYGNVRDRSGDFDTCLRAPSAEPEGLFEELLWRPPIQ